MIEKEPYANSSSSAFTAGMSGTRRPAIVAGGNSDAGLLGRGIACAA